MAKLSLKGIVSLSHQIIKDGKTNTHNIELFQDDFEDCVMLTIDEAKEILKDLKYLGYMTSSPTQETKAYNHSNMLLHRLEQAEVAKIGDDYNKALNKVVEEFQK